jgi:hypothetical protein
MKKNIVSGFGAIVLILWLGSRLLATSGDFDLKIFWIERGTRQVNIGFDNMSDRASVKFHLYVNGQFLAWGKKDVQPNKADQTLSFEVQEVVTGTVESAEIVIFEDQVNDVQLDSQVWFDDEATNTPTPTSTSTLTNTPEPTVTNTPEPTATNTPEPTPTAITATKTPTPVVSPTPSMKFANVKLNYQTNEVQLTGHGNAHVYKWANGVQEGFQNIELRQDLIALISPNPTTTLVEIVVDPDGKKETYKFVVIAGRFARFGYLPFIAR